MSLTVAPTRAVPNSRGTSKATALSGDKLVTASIVIATVGSLFSIKLGGRFAVSNVAQIIALLAMLRAYPRLLRGRDLALLALGAGFILVAAISVSVIYDYQITVTHSLFFALAAAYLLAIYRACADHGASDAVALGFRRAIPVALAVLLVMLTIDLGTGSAKRRLGFDDKSHASVMACFLAFAALRFLNTQRRLLYALAFFTISLLTISRLPFIFAPAFVIALLLEYRRVRATARTAWQVYSAHLVIGAIAIAPIVLAQRVGDLFTVFGRVLSPGSNTDASTRAHLLLLDYAAQLKIENFWNFLFGVTPGGFSGVAVRSRIDLREYAAVDPPGWRKFAVGEAPMHSSLGSILLEFPLWVALVYLGLAVWALITLLRRREYIIALLLVSFLMATSVYSSHNELYFYVVWTAAIAMALRRGSASTEKHDVAPARVSDGFPIERYR